MWIDLSRSVLEIFADAQGETQRDRLRAWEAKRRRRRPTEGEMITERIEKKCAARIAIAKAIADLGLTTEEAIDALDFVRDEYESASSPTVKPTRQQTSRPPRAPRSAAAEPKRVGRPRSAIPPAQEATRTIVEKHGTITLQEFMKTAKLERSAACHRLKSTAKAGRIHDAGGGIYQSLSEARKHANGAAA